MGKVSLDGASAVDDHDRLAERSELSGEGDRAWLAERAQRQEGWP